MVCRFRYQDRPDPGEEQAALEEVQPFLKYWPFRPSNIAKQGDVISGETKTRKNSNVGNSASPKEQSRTSLEFLLPWRKYDAPKDNNDSNRPRNHMDKAAHLESQQETGRSDPTVSNSFLFAEFLNIEAFLGVAKNVGGHTTVAAETLLRQVSERVEELLRDTTSSADLSSFLHWANEIVSNNNRSNIGMAMTETREFAARLLAVADGLLTRGYVDGDPWAGKEKAILQDMHASDNNKRKGRTTTSTPEALFDHFQSAVELNNWTSEMEDTYRMAQMASIIYYEKTAIISNFLARGESLVAMGTTADIMWTVTDSLRNDINFGSRSTGNRKPAKPRLIRTVTIRGFDASDESVDRQGLFSTICCQAQPKTLSLKNNPYQKILVHSGLYQMAQTLYRDLKHYVVDWLSRTDTKVVLVGHSLGGSLATILLVLVTLDQGVEFAKQRIQKVYAFGAPPILALAKKSNQQQRRNAPVVLSMDDDDNEELNRRYSCEILSALGLPSTMVHGYIQPWDPIPRLFTPMDPLYPLIGEIDMKNGDDGMVLWPRGPPRTLRRVTSAIIDAWGEGWCEFRDGSHKNMSQNYTCVGLQHIFLPEPTRYLTDRFLTVDIAVPPVQTILRLSSKDFYPALAKAFPLDVSEISYVPQAIRSFVHHFYPAYSSSLNDFVKRIRREEAQKLDNQGHDDDDGLEDHLCFISDDDEDDGEDISLTAMQQLNRTPKPDIVSPTEGIGNTVIISESHHNQDLIWSNVQPWDLAARLIWRNQNMNR